MMNEDYTNVTITTIVTISLVIIAYFIVSDINEIVSEVSASFSSSSALVLAYRILCFSASAYNSVRVHADSETCALSL